MSDRLGRPANQAIAAQLCEVLASSTVFALSGKEVGPGDDLGMLLEQGAALTLGHASPDAELHSIVQRVSAALGDDGAMPADHRGFALGSAADEQFIRIRLATPGL